MKSFLLRARTVVNDSKWFNFTLADIPTKYDTEHIALLNNIGSPLLQLDTVVRGENNTKLYEGDIIEDEGMRYVICYERGFYAITEDYIAKNLYQLKEPKVVGDYWIDGFPIQIRVRKKQMYKYKDINFKITDIIAHWGNKIIIRAHKDPIDPVECRQECCLSYDNKKVYMGDMIKNHEVENVFGRICYKDDVGYYDLGFGGYLNDYNNTNAS